MKIRRREMLNRLCEMSINWIGMALGAALIVCGFVMTCSPFIMPTTAWKTKDGAPCYCSLIQMSIVSLLFYTLGRVQRDFYARIMPRRPPAAGLRRGG